MSQKVCIKIGLRVFHKSVRKVRDNEVTFDTNHKSSFMFLRTIQVNQPVVLDTKTIWNANWIKFVPNRKAISDNWFDTNWK